MLQLKPQPSISLPVAVFYAEVVDSLQRGFEEKLSCDNLILEINSSRYAYNVTLSDVTTLTVKAVLNLSTRVNASAKSLLVYFLPLFKNYIKTAEAQAECLSSMEVSGGMTDCCPAYFFFVLPGQNVPFPLIMFCLN